MHTLKSTALALVVAILSAGAAAAQAPSRPVTMIVPFPAGGATDLLARTLADHMKGTLGQTVIVENVPGAGGSIGVSRVARAAPDGTSLSVGNWASHVGSGATYPVNYDLLTDLAPVARLADTPLLIVAKNALPARNLKELIAWLKTNRASASTVGVGSASHMCGVHFQNTTGTRFQFVPYRGGAPAMQDLTAGQIDFMCDMAANALPHVRGGRVKALAVMAKSRWFAAPEIPTAGEMGVAGLDFSMWHGLWAPKGTPPDVVARLNAAVVAAFADATVRKRFADQGHEIPPADQLTPAALAAYHKADIDKWWPIIKAANIKVEQK